GRCPGSPRNRTHSPSVCGLRLDGAGRPNAAAHHSEQNSAPFTGRLRFRNWDRSNEGHPYLCESVTAKYANTLSVQAHGTATTSQFSDERSISLRRTPPSMTDDE